MIENFPSRYYGLAITDINNCLVIGADSLVAPMIESEFALKKYIESLDTNLTAGQRKDMDFYINIESKMAYKNLNSILDSKFSKNSLAFCITCLLYTSPSQRDS